MANYQRTTWLNKIKQLQVLLPAFMFLAAFAFTSVLQAAEKVSPLFIHGQGMGIIGAPGENSSVFLSEAVGNAIIREEFARVKVNADKNDVVLADVLPINSPPPNESLPTPKLSLILDGYDAKENVAFEFVSFNDANAFRKRNSGAPGETINILACAQFIDQALLAVDLEFQLAIFYDPAVKLADVTAEMLADNTRTPADLMQQLSRELLRQQVRDFLQMAKLLPIEEEIAEQ